LQLADATTPAGRAKIVLHAVDGKPDHLAQFAKVAAQHGVKEVRTYHGLLANIDLLLGAEAQFDFVTCINVFHELPPEELPSLLISSIARLSPTGLLFVYDMESLDPTELELGAVNWTIREIREILNTLSTAIGYSESIGVYPWHHTRTEAWHFEISSRQLDKSIATLITSAAHVRHQLDQKIRAIIERKFEFSRIRLEALTIGGTATAAEANTKIQSLYEYWALSRTRDRLAK
jgi:2-polyprenyl-3-methyl-5-hydroxy-6-metoxy-1,4-benzoquinol methylase